jgi:hypothetical protein
MGGTQFGRSVLIQPAGSVLQLWSYNMRLSDPSRFPAHNVSCGPLWLAEICSETLHSSTSINSLKLGMTDPLYLQHND